MERYREYKDSGVQWLGEIPSHWKTTRLKNVMTLLNGRAYLQPELQDDGKYRILRVGNFFTNDKWYYSDLELEASKYCEKGDLLFAWSASFGPYIWNGEKVIYHYHIWKVLLKSIYDKFYAYYMFLMLSDVKRRDVHGSTMVHLTLQDMNQTHVPLPSFTEQKVIVSYLDTKCSKLDVFIVNKEKEITLLQEMKQRVIADAVTRGLNPNVKLKPTNIPWLPEIPEHWKLETLRKFLRMESVKNRPELPLLSVTREQGVIARNVESKEENHNFIPTDLSGYKYVAVGDFCINKMKSWQGSYGVSEYEGIVSPAYFVCKLAGVDKLFFSMAIRCKQYVSFFAQYSKGIRVDQWDLSPIGLKSIPFFLPPIDEQRSIVSYITERTAKIDTLIEKLNKEIECVKEYKQRLISDVVTGQIKVG